MVETDQTAVRRGSYCPHNRKVGEGLRLKLAVDLSFAQKVKGCEGKLAVRLDLLLPEYHLRDFIVLINQIAVAALLLADILPRNCLLTSLLSQEVVKLDLSLLYSFLPQEAGFRSVKWSHLHRRKILLLSEIDMMSVVVMPDLEMIYDAYFLLRQLYLVQPSVLRREGEDGVIIDGYYFPGFEVKQDVRDDSACREAVLHE